MRKIDVYKEYCTGCGLCHSVLNISFSENTKGFMYPDLKEENLEFCEKFCPACSYYDTMESQYTMWGKISKTYIGWALDDAIRYSASSGGVLTAVCCYLLNEGIVDGIIQTAVGKGAPYSTKTVISRTSDDVLKCMGSRYSNSSPLFDLEQIVKKNEKYAFVGKPCDVQSLKLYLKNNVELASQIECCLSFFCAGVPSNVAQKSLLKRLGCEDVMSCTHLDYRGNGWPDFATAYKSDGSSQRISYDESWGGILGRDIRKSCRFCIDGIGDYADIVCADAWHTQADGMPDFEEHSGRNAIFSRSQVGDQIICGAFEKGCIYIQRDDYYFNNFARVQRFQNERRGAMLAMLLAMKLFRKNIPLYNINKLVKLSRNVCLKIKIKRFIGTVKRIMGGKI